MFDVRCPIRGTVASGFLHKHRQALQALGPDQYVDHVAVGLAEELLALLLRDAAGDGDEGARAGFLAHQRISPRRV